MFILITFVRTNGQTVGQTKNDLEKQLVENTNNSQEKVSSVHTNYELKKQVSPTVPENTQRTIAVHD